MKNSILFSAVLVAAGTAWAEAPRASENQQRVYTYALQLDGDGELQHLAPHGFADDAISRKLDTEIRGWIFEAVEAPHHHGPATTFLRVVVAPHADATSGGFNLVSAMTGPAPEHLTRPAFPAQDQRAGLQGSVVLKLQIGTDGRVASADVHNVIGSVSRKMAQAATASALDWRFTPETVGGEPLASSVLWPVCFLGASSSASDCTWVGPDSQQFSSKTVLTLNPAARLVSPLAFEER